MLTNSLKTLKIRWSRQLVHLRVEQSLRRSFVALVVVVVVIVVVVEIDIGVGFDWVIHAVVVVADAADDQAVPGDVRDVAQVFIAAESRRIGRFGGGVIVVSQRARSQNRSGRSGGAVAAAFSGAAVGADSHFPASVVAEVFDGNRRRQRIRRRRNG